jgi:hypothetical protein
VCFLLDAMNPMAFGSKIVDFDAYLVQNVSNSNNLTEFTIG